MSEHVLVPVDGSEPSFAAVRHAARHHPGVTVTVLHVVDPSEGVLGEADTAFYSRVTIENAMDRGHQMCERARELMAEEATDGPRQVDEHVEIGRPAETILDFAADHDVDHIVMGSAGRSDVSRLLLGSVAETVVRRASIPVTIVR